MRNSTVLLRTRQPSSVPSSQPARKPLPAGSLYHPSTQRKFRVTYRIGVKEHTADRVAETADCARAHFELYRYSVLNVVEIDAAGNEVAQQAVTDSQPVATTTEAKPPKPRYRFRSPLARRIDLLAESKGMTIHQYAAHFSFASEAELLRTAAAAKEAGYASLAAAGRDKGVKMGTALAECFGVADSETARSATA